MFRKLKNYLQKTCAIITAPLNQLFTKAQVNTADIDNLQILLLQADAGVKASTRIIDALRSQLASGIVTGAACKDVLSEQLVGLLHSQKFNGLKPVILFVGANGTGKTTTIAKVACMLHSQNKKVLIAACDTFRAAAVDQLAVWAQQIGCDIVRGTPGQDSAAVAYQACERYKQGQYDVLLIDTAGRLQTKANLMHELGKLVRVVKKQVGQDQVCTLLTIDGMLGQNSFEQAKLFQACIPIDGVVLTKMDGSGKGGVVFAIVHDLHIPIAYLTFGEDSAAIKLFDCNEYVRVLLDHS